MEMTSAVATSAVCCFHHSELLGGNVVSYDFLPPLPRDSGFTVTAFQCPRHPVCDAHYAPTRGYFGARNGENPRFSYQGVPACGHEDQTFYMFLMHENDELVWACPIDGCTKRVQPSVELLARQAI